MKINLSVPALKKVGEGERHIVIGYLVVWFVFWFLGGGVEFGWVHYTTRRGGWIKMVWILVWEPVLFVCAVLPFNLK